MNQPRPTIVLSSGAKGSHAPEREIAAIEVGIGPRSPAPRCASSRLLSIPYLFDSIPPLWFVSSRKRRVKSLSSLGLMSVC
jgi:hypothetical protein